MKGGILSHIASLVCHQINDRSFSIGEHYLPLCARCTGIYSGFLVAALSQLLTWDIKSVPPLTSRKVLVSIILLSALVVESLAEKFGIWEWSNPGRFYSGFLGGMGIGILLLPICSHFLGFRTRPVKDKATRQWVVSLVLTAAVFSLLRFPVLLSLLAYISILGLLLIYFLLNVAVSGAVLNLRGRAYNTSTVMLLFGLVLVLFAGEWITLSMLKPHP